MSRFARSTPGALLLTLLIGLFGALATLMFLVSLAHAQPVVPEVAYVPPFVWPDVETLLLRGSAASLIVGTTLLFARGGFPWLTNGSDHARLVNYALAIGVGLATGLLHVAPQMAPGTPGWLLGGFLSGGLACFGRDGIVTGARVVQAAKTPDVPPAAP